MVNLCTHWIMLFGTLLGGLIMLDLKNTIAVNINWQNVKSIELAEQAKASLENDSWILINTFGGMNSSVLVYAKEK